MELELWLVRHAQTPWNASGRFQGQTDVPLSAHGVSEAQRLARRLSGQAFAALIASDLSRAQDTASIVSKSLLGHPRVDTDARWREINVGEKAGLTHAEAEERGYKRSPGYFVAHPGGESHAEVAGRAWAAAQDLAQTHLGERVMVVTHGVTMRTFVRALLFGLDNPTASPLSSHHNTGITRLALWPDATQAHGMGGRLLSYNDAAHLEDAFVVPARASDLV